MTTAIAGRSENKMKLEKQTKAKRFIAILSISFFPACYQFYGRFSFAFIRHYSNKFK